MDMFGFIPTKPRVVNNESSSEEAANHDEMQTAARRKVNVVIFGIDAVSHMNFIRVMPRTLRFLTEELGAIGMNGYTKVGDNTFPNMGTAALKNVSTITLKY